MEIHFQRQLFVLFSFGFVFFFCARKKRKGMKTYTVPRSIKIYGTRL